MAHAGKAARTTEERSIEDIERDCLTVLNAEPFDWEAAYLRLRYSPLGADYPPEVFLRTPVNTIRRLIEEVENRQMEERNTLSVTAAQIAYYTKVIVHNLLKVEGPLPDAALHSYLPYPDWGKEGNEKKGPSDTTKLVLKEALKQRKLPLYVYLALMGIDTEQS